MQVFVPVMTKEQFAQATGLSADVIRGQISRGYLPTVKLGRYRLINVEALRQRSAEEGRQFSLKGA